MILDIFSGRRRSRGGDKKDATYEVIQIIERFAPKEYSSEREVHYYNYKMLGPYLRPLLALLELLSQRQRLQDDRPVFVRELFLRLKDFYDPKNRLSPAEATSDGGLVKRFSELFLFFYNIKDLPAEDMEEWLEDISR
ncbi:MAG: hypothetical protein HQ561_12540 [Desulfobacteraceae bacterium]|nr:hypothetical protein [Desulfobacteraceae bacterium]